MDVVPWLSQVVFRREGTLLKRLPTLRLRRILTFCAVVTLGTLIGLTQHEARTLEYNFLCPIIVVSLAKLLCSLTLLVLVGGENICELPLRLWSLRGLVLRYSCVSALYCLYDVLSFVNLKQFDPQTYGVFLQLRTVLSGAIWEFVLAKPLTWQQRGALCLLCLSCTVKQARGLRWEEATGRATYAWLLLGVQVVTNCFAGMANELLLKGQSGASLYLQNSMQYLWTIIWCLLVGIVCPVDGLKLKPFDLTEWAKMSDVRMLPSIVVLTLLGLVTAWMLKILDSVWKAIASAVQLVLTPFAAELAFGYPIQPRDAVSLALSILGVWLYAHPQRSWKRPLQRGA